MTWTPTFSSGLFLLTYLHDIFLLFYLANPINVGSAILAKTLSTPNKCTNYILFFFLKIKKYYISLIKLFFNSASYTAPLPFGAKQIYLLF